MSGSEAERAVAVAVAGAVAGDSLVGVGRKITACVGSEHKKKKTKDSNEFGGRNHTHNRREEKSMHSMYHFVPLSVSPSDNHSQTHQSIHSNHFQTV